MRISGKPSGVGSTQSATGPKTSGAPASAPVTSVSGSDAVQVSSEARLVAVAQEALAVVPDIRMEKVEAIKVRLDADAYNPDGEAVAEGLIKEHMAKGRQS
ncbi:MAG: flagellar biosynthesis anti-sigma factor FlgM [Geothrix sp.]|uniref:flagellar biosynthesis anti-sigma factor FlgM n=1 Tax=Geothrix sp. TaxID=1962974 RepID=UPI00182370FC|nr:flagellar biosynthesis anti-sigma factor FlgM [Geothrix sp.]NWJ40109.1 flagellar biosynthesis anti-sigma factor FlgM [Geothrix sp.]WIL21882.1 MAG: flagellar biosynthesis anti-sigma factor FlgM [Geothrix sp.]